MKSIKKIQKMFYLSSEYVKEFIENRIEDMAMETNRSTSYIIEQILMDGLLPTNEEARSLIRYDLYPATGENGIKRALEAAFNRNSAGTDWKSQHNNFKKLLEYCVEHVSPSSKCNKDEPTLHHLNKQFDSIVKRIKELSNVCIEPFDRNMYTTETAWAEVLLAISERNPIEMNMKEYFILILDCWDMLYDWSITFRFLADLVYISTWDDTPDLRNELFDIINELSKEW